MEQHQPYTVIEDTQHFKQIIRNEDTENVLYVIDFHATWCGPCKKIAPDYTKLAEKYGKHMLFMKCDVDEAQELSDVFSIESLPTFVFGYNKNIIDKFEGANLKKVEAKINEYITMEDRQYALLSDGCDDEEQSDGVEHDEEQSDGEEHDEEQSDGDEHDEEQSDGDEHDEEQSDGVEHDEEQDDLDVNEIIDTLQQDETHEKEQPETESNSVKELKKKNKELQQRCSSLEKDKKRLEKVLLKIKSMMD